MLQNVLSGTPNLVHVLNLHCQTKKAAGQSIKISLRECIALLAHQAQLCDNAKTHTGQNCHQSAAAHELAGQEQDCKTIVHDFDGKGDEEPQLKDISEANAMNQRDPKTGRYLGNKERQEDGGQDSRRVRTRNTKQMKCKALTRS